MIKFIKRSWKVILFIIILIIFVFLVECDGSKKTKKVEDEISATDVTTLVTSTQTTTKSTTIVNSKNYEDMEKIPIIHSFHTDWYTRGDIFLEYNTGFVLNGEKIYESPKNDYRYPRFFETEKEAKTYPFQTYFVDTVELNFSIEYDSRINVNEIGNTICIKEGINEIVTKSGEKFYIYLQRSEVIPEKITVLFDCKIIELNEGKLNTLVLEKKDLFRENEDKISIYPIGCEENVLDFDKNSMLLINAHDSEEHAFTLLDHKGEEHIFKYIVVVK